jgi:predicted Fe-Mo cluster-binding NifX family protein
LKIVFTTSGSDLNAPLDSRFGRSPRFLVYDLDSETFEVVDNRQVLDSPQGAGIQAAETVARLGAGGLVTRNCGPKAYKVLSAAGIAIFNSEAATVAAALEQYRNGELKEAGSANVAGHWT